MIKTVEKVDLKPFHSVRFERLCNLKACTDERFAWALPQRGLGVVWRKIGPTDIERTKGSRRAVCAAGTSLYRQDISKDPTFRGRYMGTKGRLAYARFQGTETVLVFESEQQYMELMHPNTPSWDVIRMAWEKYQKPQVRPR